MILAPLRGVTVRSFRESFSSVIKEAGFTEAITPFISAMPGVDPLADRELKKGPEGEEIAVTPQFIGKDPAELRRVLKRVKDAGWTRADLNGGCPFPMVRKKGRGSGLMKTPDTLCRMLEAGCEEMPGGFSLKVRLGVDEPSELEKLMPLINNFPLRFLTVHARTAWQMYEGECDRAALERVSALSRIRVVVNGDLPVVPFDEARRETMVGRSFIRSLGERPDIKELLAEYVERSRREFGCDRPVLGRMKELVAYWRELPKWRRLWNVVKICRTTDEFLSI